MNNRLQQFLELENITPARLADTLGVQRSGLSHILSGRNKPGYEFLTKLLTKFPHINSDWLLLGKGKPYKNFTDGEDGSSPLLSNRNKQNSNTGNSGLSSSLQNHNMYDSILYDNIQDNSIQNNGVYGNIVQGNGIPYSSIPNNGLLYNDIQNASSLIFDGNSTPSPESHAVCNGENNTDITDNQCIESNNTQFKPSENCVNGTNRGNGCKKKSIKRVIVFYSDGSFEELFPHIR